MKRRKLKNRLSFFVLAIIGFSMCLLGESLLETREKENNFVIKNPFEFLKESSLPELTELKIYKIFL